MKKMKEGNLALLVEKFLLLVLLLALSPELSAQGFSSLYVGLDELDRLMSLQQQTQERQQKLLNDLEIRIQNSEQSSAISNQKIKDLKSISEAQGEYVNRLLEQSRQAELIRQAQLKYQKGLERELKLWKVGTIALGASTLGLLVWNLASK